MPFERSWDIPFRTSQGDARVPGSPPEGLSCHPGVSRLRRWRMVELGAGGVLLPHVVYGPPFRGDGPIWVLLGDPL